MNVSKLRKLIKHLNSRKCEKRFERARRWARSQPTTPCLKGWLP